MSTYPLTRSTKCFFFKQRHVFIGVALELIDLVFSMLWSYTALTQACQAVWTVELVVPTWPVVQLLSRAVSYGRRGGGVKKKMKKKKKCQTEHLLFICLLIISLYIYSSLRHHDGSDSRCCLVVFRSCYLVSTRVLGVHTHATRDSRVSVEASSGSAVYRNLKSGHNLQGAKPTHMQ